MSEPGSFAELRISRLRPYARTLALLFPAVLVLSEAVLRYTHHRPLGAMTVAVGTVALAFALRGLVHGLSAEDRSASTRDSSSQIETDDAPMISGVMSRRGPRNRDGLLIGVALIAWPLALAWVFFG